MSENLNVNKDNMENTVDKEFVLEDDRDFNKSEVLPCIPLRGVTIFPKTVVHFDVGREKSIKALEKAMTTDKLLFVSTQKDDNILIPKADDIYEVGTVVRVKQMLKIQGDAVRVLVEGVSRATVSEVLTSENFYSAVIMRCEEVTNEEELSLEDKAMSRLITESFVEYAAITSQITDEVVDKIISEENTVKKADKIANELFVLPAKKQKVLRLLFWLTPMVLMAWSPISVRRRLIITCLPLMRRR